MIYSKVPQISKHFYLKIKYVDDCTFLFYIYS